jgi:hypothetical protein
MYAKCYICSFLGLRITNLSILFYLFLNLKKMRKIYSIIYSISAILIMTVIVAACSKTEEDIGAPTITFNYPLAGTTVKLQKNYLHVSVLAEDRGIITKMEMLLQDEETHEKLGFYGGTIKINQSYPCKECFELDPVNKITKLRLTVTAGNGYSDDRTKSIVFYLSP